MLDYAILCSLYISKLCKSVCCVGIEIVSIKVIYCVQIEVQKILHPGYNFHTFVQKLLHRPLEMWYMGAYSGVGACPRYYGSSGEGVPAPFPATLSSNKLQLC